MHQHHVVAGHLLIRKRARNRWATFSLLGSKDKDIGPVWKSDNHSNNLILLMLLPKTSRLCKHTFPGTNISEQLPWTSTQYKPQRGCKSESTSCNKVSACCLLQLNIYRGQYICCYSYKCSSTCKTGIRCSLGGPTLINYIKKETNQKPPRKPAEKNYALINWSRLCCRVQRTRTALTCSCKMEASSQTCSLISRSGFYLKTSVCLSRPVQSQGEPDWIQTEHDFRSLLI